MWIHPAAGKVAEFAGKAADFLHDENLEREDRRDKSCRIAGERDQKDVIAQLVCRREDR